MAGSGDPGGSWDRQNHGKFQMDVEGPRVSQCVRGQGQLVGREESVGSSWELWVILGLVSVESSVGDPVLGRMDLTTVRPQEWEGIP